MVSAHQTEAALSKKVIGNLVTWDQARGFEDIKTNIDVFSEVSVHWYTTDASGKILPYLDWAGKSYVDPTIISYLRANNVLVTASIENIRNGDWDGPMISRIINSSTLATAHINNIVSLAVNNNFDGVDIDYEYLQATDRAAFSSFIQNLAGALHAQNKILAVNVFAKTSEPGGWDSPQAQDWSVIGEAADEVRIMTYGYSWSASPAGPLAPINWVGDVLSFATTVISPDKIIHGIPTYGNDWPNGSAGTEYMWDQLMSLATNHNSLINWDATSMSPWFQYTSSGIQHKAWFENASSTDAKLSLTNQNNLGGVFIWRVAGEDPMTWSVLRSRFSSPVVLPTADIKVNGSDSSITIPFNSSAILSWISGNATSCSVLPGGWTDLSSSGISTGNLSTSTTYSIICSNSSGSTMDSVTVNVLTPPVIDTESPTISIVEPIEGTVVSNRQKITATAIDNVGVAKVVFYLDGVSIATDTFAPYTTNLITNKLSSGNHIVRAVAHDVAGNSASSQIIVYKR